MRRKPVGKREIARHEQFLLFPQCFHKTCTADTCEPGLVWARFKTEIVFITLRLTETAHGVDVKIDCTFCVLILYRLQKPLLSSFAPEE